MKNLLLLFSIIISVSFFSCSTDEESLDLRDQVVGKYEGVVSIYALDGVEDEKQIIKQEFSVEKSLKNSSSINFVIDGEKILVGSKLAEATNGFTFDLLSQNFTEDGENYLVTGTNIIELGDTKYNGAYFSSDKKIMFAFNLEIDNEMCVMLFSGKKK